MFRGFVILCLLAFVAVASAKDYQWGECQKDDRLLARKFVKRPYKWLQVVTEDVDYPDEMAYPPQRATITQIVIIDQKDKGGEATLSEGGVGLDYASIHLKSGRNHGMDFIVEIYGH